MSDPIEEIEKKLNEAWALNEKDGFGQPDALIAIKNLLKSHYTLLDLLYKAKGLILVLARNEKDFKLTDPWMEKFEALASITEEEHD